MSGAMIQLRCPLHGIVAAHHRDVTPWSPRCHMLSIFRRPCDMPLTREWAPPDPATRVV